MRSTVRVLSVALAATLVVAACGSDESGSSEATPTETIAGVETTVADTAPTTIADTVAPTSTPEVPTQDVGADTAAAETALLALADLPEGWTEAPVAEGAAALSARLAECVDVVGDAISAADASAATARFAGADGAASVSQHVGVLATEGEARTVVAFTVEPDVPACFEAAYAELATDALALDLAAGAQTGAPVATRLQVGPAGDATQAIRVSVPVTGDPVVTEVTVDHVIVRSGRSLATLTFAGAAEPTALETIDGITAVVAERLPV